jgi:hypothetical protein
MVHGFDPFIVPWPGRALRTVPGFSSIVAAGVEGKRSFDQRHDVAEIDHSRSSPRRSAYDRPPNRTASQDRAPGSPRQAPRQALMGLVRLTSLPRRRATLPVGRDRRDRDLSGGARSVYAMIDAL